jgi:hypothetical protein
MERDTQLPIPGTGGEPVELVNEPPADERVVRRGLMKLPGLAYADGFPVLIEVEVVQGEVVDGEESKKS